MKMLWMTITLILLAFPLAHAGSCKLKGRKVAGNISFFFNRFEKQTFEVAKFDECLNHAKKLLKLKRQITYCKYDFDQRCHEVTVTMTIRKVKYKFKENNRRITGVIR
jgi:hypothetical protein